VEERSSRRRSASPPSSSSSPASSCAFEPYTAVAGESLPVSEVDDARAPLDSNPTATYRFGIVSDLTGRPHLSGLKRKRLPPAKRYLGRPVRESFGAAQFC
jgi:hypothetical protein